MRRVFAQELGTVGIPQRNLDEFGEGLFKDFQFFSTDVLEKQVFVGVFLGIFRKEPEIIVGIRHHVGQGKLFFLRKVYRQLHVVGRTFVRHQPAHVLLEEGLSPHHQVREYGLVGRVVTEMLVAREYIVHEGSTAAPVSQNEYRVVFQRFVGQQLLVTAFLQGGKGGKQTAYGLGQAVFAFVGRVDGSASGNLLESFPVGSHQGIDR